MTSYLIYTSERLPHCVQEEIDDILRSCQQNNSKKDITGVLLYSDTRFVQYLEGDFKAIYRLFEKIKKDHRHKNVIMVSSARIEKRVFPTWQMGSKSISDNVEILTELDDQDKGEFTAILKGEEREGNNAIRLMKNFFR